MLRRDSLENKSSFFREMPNDPAYSLRVAHDRLVGVLVISHAVPFGDSIQLPYLFTELLKLLRHRLFMQCVGFVGW